MQSSNFRIYDSTSDVGSVYAGPAIANIGVTADNQSATISWQTNDLSDSFVLFSTDSTLASSIEHGSPTKSSTSHTVTVPGLLPSTVYFFKTRSTGLYGGASYSPISSYTTSASPAAVPAKVEKFDNGSGVIYIEKKDFIAPIISRPTILELNADKAVIYWTSDELANSFVQYLTPGDNSKSTGDWSFVNDHYLTLIDLEPNTTYSYRALSADAAGNLASSALATFTTLKEGEKGKPAIIPGKPAGGSGSTTININDLPATMGRVLTALTNFSIGNKANEFEALVGDFLNSLRDISSNIPGPSLVGRPKITIENNQVTIGWQTDKPAGTQVALASDKEYKPQNNEPYYLFQGNNEVLTTNHEITVAGLLPDTIYHYQVRSRSGLGVTNKSDDYTFKVSPELPTIVNYNFEVTGPNKVVFRWVTNQETDTNLRTVPINGATPEYSKSKSFYDKTLTIIHQIEIGDLANGTTYVIELSGKTKKGEAVNRKIADFSTTKDKSAPEIDQIRAEVAFTSGKFDVAQAIISWKTNESASSRVYYVGGAREFEIKDAQYVDIASYAVKHVAVVNKLASGQVYSYRVASTDSSGNVATSNVHTVYIPRKPESLFDLFFKYFKQIFGWVGNIRR
ncbi:MAG: fibronectin type III domain-containing protein [bacterium]